MTFDDEAVMAYVDGELDAAARAAFEQVLSGDHELASRVSRQRRLRSLLSETYGPVLDEPVPARLRQPLATAPRTRGPAGRARSLRERLRRWLHGLAVPQAVAMAACALLGIALGVGFRAPSGAFDASDGRLVARGDLARALSERLSGDPPSGSVHVGLSFVARQGSYCRSFTMRGPTAMAGLACHSDGPWRVETLTVAANTGNATPGYRQAGSETPPELLRAIDERIVGDALDAAAERSARERGWRR